MSYANSLPLDQRNIYIATPYPGTPLYSLCKKKGYLNSDGDALFEDLLYTKGLISTPEFSSEEIELIKKEDRERAMTRKAGVV